MQEFLASFAVDIDEAGVSRLQKILRDNRDLAGQVAEAFDTARKAMEDLFSFSPEDLKSVMTSCLNHTEVLLPAGYQPVMQGSSWSWPELEHDTASCLKLTLEEALWTLTGFFGEGGSNSRPAGSTSSPPPART